MSERASEPPGFPALKVRGTMNKLVGEVYLIGTNGYELVRQIGEDLDMDLNLRWSVFEAKKISNRLKVIVKSFIELHPAFACLQPNRGIYRGLERTAIEREIRALRECSDVKGVPHFLERSSREVAQDQRFEYPGGELDVVVMTRLPGYPLNFYYGQLDTWEVEHIRTQVLTIVR
ncbi:uncharacterized protein BO97DRAFT_432459 [Aspergillus homomorphus CBS 101889]|uniref:Uncharacterized protein n=1 Tax=Aspergillus homomorphus (strain CBS 101889) TaxID=1450537 RepID=A0A395I7R4_ASPHC|nr:hypothetical protein BO97DRAFT_432459 [Aspergillus homomorphus CBS 101889]RAL15293.1 hypothetical protein BO97DRAFT_432459 [Aspergillus homomorphus CBS 101889]